MRTEIKLFRLQAVLAMQVTDLAGFRMEATYAVVRAHPDPALFIKLDAVDHVVGKTVFLRRILEIDVLRRRWVSDDTVKPAAVGTHPDRVVGVDVD